MRRTTYSLLLSLAAVAACGDDSGDGDGNTPDAPTGPDAPMTDAPDSASCGAPVTTISTFPASYDGVVLGAGNDLSADEGACADERGYFGASGDDHVIELTNLTPGTRYALTLTTAQDIMMYVTEECTGGEPSTGSCLLLVDETTGDESGEFVAPADGAVFLVIDTPDDVTLTTGAYTLDIAALECLTSFECTTAAEPVCTAGACVAGGADCTGDDANEHDDGPAAAQALAFPGATPTVTTGAVCNVPATEADWFTFTAAAAGTVRIAATWTNTAADLDFIVYDATGEEIARADAIDFTQEIGTVDLPAAGDYFVELYAYDPMNTAAATTYTLTLGLPECETSFDCSTAAEPVCASGECVAGPAACTGDDAADTNGATSDDGPAGASPIVGAVGVPVTVNASVCHTPATESDWYSVVTTEHGQGIRAELAWAATGSIDVDVYILDADGNVLGTSFWLNPEVVTTTYLPMGIYYVNVVRFDTPAAAHPYTLTVTTTAAQDCVDAASCAAEHQTQVYRGACNVTTGACEFIPAGNGANGTACDTGDDCMSGDCSYIIFESDAQDSVCTTTCTATGDCAGLGGGFTCTTGFQTNICVPQCAADLECGANLNSDALDTGLPWDYLTCTLPAGTCGP